MRVETAILSLESTNENVFTSKPFPEVLLAATRLVPCPVICQPLSSNSLKLRLASSHFEGIEYAEL